jgi:hypothetical protein
MSFVTNVLLPKYTGVSLNGGPPINTINNCSTGRARLGRDVLADRMDNTGLRISASPSSISHGSSHHQQTMKSLCYPYAGYLYGGRAA